MGVIFIKKKGLMIYSSNKYLIGHYRKILCIFQYRLRNMEEVMKLQTNFTYLLFITAYAHFVKQNCRILISLMIFHLIEIKGRCYAI